MLTDEELKKKANRKLKNMLVMERRRLKRLKEGGVQWQYFSPEQVKQIRIENASRLCTQLEEIVGLLD